MKTSSIGYVTITRLDHYGELGVPSGKCTKEGEAEFILLNCHHGQNRVWLKRGDIK